MIKKNAANSPKRKREISYKSVTLPNQEGPVAKVTILLKQFLSSLSASLKPAMEPLLAEVKFINWSTLKEHP